VNRAPGSARRGPPVVGLALAIGVAAVAAVLVAAFEPFGPPGSPTPGSGGSITSGTGQTLEPPTTIGPPPSPSAPDDTAPVLLDPTLLEILPESIGGIEVTEAIDEAAIALADPALPRIATGLDVGVALDTATANLVTAHVVKLRPEAFTDATFSQWRDSFDEGACAAAGGIRGLAEATIDDRTVHITSCVAGLRTYHVWLQDLDVLISASSIGDAAFGEQLMDNLRVPE
jgi:hypothetical protein